MSDSYLATLRECRIDILEALAIPHSLSLAICYRYEQWDELYALLKAADTMTTLGGFPCRTISYERAFLQANALFSKADDLPEVEQLDEQAIVSFIECESKNRETNIRFHTREVPSPLIYKTQQVIAEILGDFSMLDWSQNLRFGPGASSTCRGDFTTIVDKLASEIHCTPRAFEHLENGFKHFFQFYYSLASFDTSGCSNTYLTIPKKYDEKRGIAIGLHGNIVGQLATGASMRRKFRRWVNLDTAADYHRKLVRTEWRSIATIDLRRASQMIAKMAVRSVFPADWLEIMDDMREEFTFIPNMSDTIHGTPRYVYNQHYSAMGNGYTFEMESILFYSLAKAAMLNAGLKWKILSVFGDDVIVDKHCADVVISAFEAFGFETNKSKTYTDGEFKESCGVDTLRGTNVRPVYLRNAKNGKQLEKFYKLANNIFRMAANSGHGLCIDARFYRAWKRCICQISEHKRFFAAASSRCGDGTPFGESSDTTLLYASNRKIEGHYEKYCIEIRYGRKARRTSAGDIWLGAALLGASSNGIIPRGSRHYHLKRRKLRYKHKEPTVLWA